MVGGEQREWDERSPEHRARPSLMPRLRLVESRAGRPRPRPSDEPTVLIVDDEDAIRDFLRSAFEAEGYRVLAAGDGRAALALCERYEPDVVLLDLMMPHVDGIGFVHEFRRAHGLDTPIFMMSAAWTAVEHAQAAGVTGAFVKPFDLDDLLNTAASAVAAARARRRDCLGDSRHDGRSSADDRE
jgi:DNA-binding response OmpR family regulator